MKTNHESTNTEILEAINEFSNNTDQHFGRVEQRLGRVELDVKKIKETMVTQSIFQQSITALEDRLMSMLESSDQKVIALVRILRQKDILSETEVRELFALPPFAKHLP